MHMNKYDTERRMIQLSNDICSREVLVMEIFFLLSSDTKISQNYFALIMQASRIRPSGHPQGLTIVNVSEGTV